MGSVNERRDIQREKTEDGGKREGEIVKSRGKWGNAMQKQIPHKFVAVHTTYGAYHELRKALEKNASVSNRHCECKQERMKRKHESVRGRRD